jgi:hypothetical protein
MFATVSVFEIDVTAGHLGNLNSGPFCDGKWTKGIPEFDCSHNAVGIVAVNNVKLTKKTMGFNRHDPRVVQVPWGRSMKQTDGANSHHNYGASV